jgi:hypothetical protein
MSITKPTSAEIIAYREVNETGLEEAKRAVWKRWRVATIKQLCDKMVDSGDEDAMDLLEVLESIERCLQ